MLDVLLDELRKGIKQKLAETPDDAVMKQVDATPEDTVYVQISFNGFSPISIRAPNTSAEVEKLIWERAIFRYSSDAIF
jgi:hypothetical protein